MDISLSGGDLAIRTAFSADYDLTQVLRGVRPGLLNRNEPVDFRLAGLVHRGHRDIWHIDRALAFSTDECSPFVINGEDIGGNHGEPCAMRIRVAGHGCTFRDVGTTWLDESGMGWTLLRDEDPDALLLLSDNIGPSETEYAFCNQVTGVLRCQEDGRLLSPTAQFPGQQMTRAIRHLRCDLAYQQGGAWQSVTGTHEGVDRARITEEYEVINPATVAQALRQNRPAGGYAAPQSLGVGRAMAIHRMTYRIEPDGCILCDFDHETCMNVRLTWYLGIMYQEKCDAFGGGVHRVIPKLKPFEHGGTNYDFSRPCDTTRGPMPTSRSLTSDLWINPASPPDRQLDFLRRENGANAVAFAGGFLPLHDGAPEIRRANITDAGDLVASRKTYPTFAGGKANTRPLERIRGVAYKKYFLPGEDASCYTVSHDGATWLYLDFFSPAEQRCPLPAEALLTLIESDSGLWQRTPEGIRAQSPHGYAVFRID